MLKANKIFLHRAMSIHRSGPVFWGWYVVFSSFVMLTLIYGARYSFGVFVKPMFAEYNWPMTVISLAASINLVMYASGGVFAGWLLDRVAPKWITTVSVLLTTAGFIAASFVKSPLGLYLSYGVLVGIGSAGSGAVACTASIGKWFVKKRGIAIGIAAMGIGLGTFFSTGIGGALGPILGGFIFDKTGSYRPGWIMNTVFLLIISLLILALKPSRSRLPR